MLLMSNGDHCLLPISIDAAHRRSASCNAAQCELETIQKAAQHARLTAEEQWCCARRCWQYAGGAALAQNIPCSTTTCSQLLHISHLTLNVPT
jgi:hypothetical protein